KALRGLETGSFGLGCYRGDLWGTPQQPGEDEIIRRLYTPTAERIWYIRYALKAGMSAEYVHQLTKIDPWFLANIRDIVDMEDRLGRAPDSAVRAADEASPRSLLWQAKQYGFSDRQIAFLWNTSEPEVRRLRKEWGVVPTFKCVAPCAAEFEAHTPYYYSSYERPVERIDPNEPATPVGMLEDEARPPSGKDRIMILGGGPNRIGQGIEFDYCCCQAAFALRQAGYETIMVNSNPETVSTDYDTSDHLFFEPLTVEDVLNICDAMRPKGLIVQFGGQTPLNLARALEQAGAPVLGTPVGWIELAHDR